VKESDWLKRHTSFRPINDKHSVSVEITPRVHAILFPRGFSRMMVWPPHFARRKADVASLGVDHFPVVHMCDDQVR
jgi:hypothetical protein